MDSGTTATIVGSGIALTSGLLAAAFSAWRSDKRDERTERRSSDDELRAVTTAFLTAADRLHLLIPMEADTETRLTKLVIAILGRLPNLRFFIETIGRATVGRRGFRAVEDFMAASNRLQLVATPSMLAPLLALNELLADFGNRDQDWVERWNARRGDFLAAARRESGVDTE